MAKEWLCPYCKKETVKVPLRVGGRKLCSCGSLLHRMGIFWHWGDPDNKTSKEALAQVERKRGK
jgi:hypothetical protein